MIFKQIFTFFKAIVNIFLKHAVALILEVFNIPKIVSNAVTSFKMWHQSEERHVQSCAGGNCSASQRTSGQSRQWAGVIVIKLYSSVLMVEQNKLECFSLTNIFVQVSYF